MYIKQKNKGFLAMCGLLTNSVCGMIYNTMSMDGPPKYKTEELPTDKELLEDLAMALAHYTVNSESKEIIKSAVLYRKPGRLTFRLDQNEKQLDVDTSKTEGVVADEVFDILDELQKMLIPEEVRKVLRPDDKPDEISVSFTAATLQ